MMRRRLRWLALSYGLALWLWLSVEDTAVWPAVLFGLGLATLMLALTFLDKLNLRWLPIFGLLVGLGTAVASTVLMFFKNAVHAHVFWDFPPGLMFAILQRAWVWAAAGGLVGLGLTLWIKSFKHDHKQPSQEVAEDAA